MYPSYDHSGFRVEGERPMTPTAADIVSGRLNMDKLRARMGLEPLFGPLNVVEAVGATALPQAEVTGLPPAEQQS